MPSGPFFEVLEAAGQIAKVTEERNRDMHQLLAESERLMAPMRAAIAASVSTGAVTAALNLPTFDITNFADLGLTAQMTALQQPVTAILQASAQSIVATTSLLQIGDTVSASIRSLSPSICPRSIQGFWQPFVAMRSLAQGAGGSRGANSE